MRLAVSVNSDHSRQTSSMGPPNVNTLINDDTLAGTGNVASGAPKPSTIRFSLKRYSQSRITRGPRRMRSFWRSSSLSLRGFLLKVQNPPARCVYSQWLVTGKMFDTLEVSQDFMWAVCQHGDVFAADSTIEVVRFSSRICCPGDKKPTNFVCRPHFLPSVRAR